MNELKDRRWKSIIICVAAFVGLFILIFFYIDKISNESLRIFLITLLSTVDTVILANVLWELIAKQNFALSLLRLVKISENIEQSGIETVYIDFLKIDWEAELRRTKTLTTLFTYAATWRESNRAALTNFLQGKGHKRHVMKAIVPDPNIEVNMDEFDRRFNYPKGETKKRIEDCIDFFSKMNAQVFLYNGTIQSSYYRFDNVCFMSFFNHSKEKGIVPAIKAEKGGNFYNFICNDIDAILRQSKRVSYCKISINDKGERQADIGVI